MGEEHVLKDFEQHLLAAGLGEEDATAAKEHLRVCNFELDPSCQEDTRAVARAALPEEGASDTDESLTPTELGDFDEEAFADLPPPPTTPRSGEDATAPTESGVGSTLVVTALPEEVLLDAAALHEPEPIPVTGFVVSIAKRGKHRKLHLLEGCRFKPGIDYKEFCSYGEIMPGEYDFESVCRICLPGGLPDEEPDLSGSSSSSSGEEPGPPSKKANPETSQKPEGAG